MIKKQSRKYWFYLFLCLFLPLTEVVAQSQTKTRILFVLDGSQSMLGRWNNKQKIQVANRLLKQTVDSLARFDHVEVALRVYGHQFSVAAGNRSCEDSKLEVPFASNNHPMIHKKLDAIRPQGTTPIAYSLEQTKNDFPSCGNCRNIIILITDGIEECDGDPCAVARALQKNGVTLKPFVIGMSLDVEIAKAFECVGNFYNTKDEETFTNVLGIVISQALNNTTVQVNLLDINGKANETNAAMTFYDQHSGQIAYNFVHTMNDRGVPDTLPINPLGKYRLVVHTIPPVSKENITITPGKHNVIAVDAPQGELILKVNGHNEYESLQYLIKKGGSAKTINVQYNDQKQKYIVGKYDLEVLTVPRTYINDVEISQSHTTKVEIPQAGIATFILSNPGISSIFLRDGDEINWVCDLKDDATRETVVLQPGSYMFIHRAQHARESILTKQKEFTITSGSSTQIRL